MITFLKIFENKIILNSQRALLLIKCHNENLLNIYEKISIKIQQLTMFDVGLTRADDDGGGLVVDGHGPVVGGHGQPPAHLIQAPVHQGAVVRVNFDRFF